MRAWCKIEDVERCKKQLIASTEREKNRTHVIESHHWVGRKVRDFVCGLSMLEGGIHLDPVTGYVQCYQ